MSTVKTAGFLRIWKAFLFTMIMIVFVAIGAKTTWAYTYYAYGMGGTWNGQSKVATNIDDDSYFYAPSAPTWDGATFLGYMPLFEGSMGNLDELFWVLPQETVWDLVYKIYNDIPNTYSLEKKGVYRTGIQARSYTEWSDLIVKVNGTKITGSYTMYIQGGRRYYFKINFSKSNLRNVINPGRRVSTMYCREVKAMWARPLHTHNSNGVEYNQGNNNQHIKYTYCNLHGSDHSQNRKSSNENHTWVETKSWYNYDNTTQRRDLKCSKCGRTKIESRTRYYYDPGQSGDSGIFINVSVISPTGQEDQKSGYIQLSRDGVNWSSETTDQIMSYVRSFKYNDKLYVRYTRPYYDYYELDSVTYELPMTKINDNTWCYTVQSESPRQWIHINMKYKPFDVHYILSGGNLPNKKDSYIITDTFTIGEPSLSGYTFTGWTMTCNKGKANDRSFIPCNILVPTKDVTISNMYGDITLTANYEKSGTNDDNGHNKTPDDDGLPEHITDTGDRKTPLVTDSNSKHNMFRVTK